MSTELSSYFEDHFPKDLANIILGYGYCSERAKENERILDDFNDLVSNDFKKYSDSDERLNELITVFYDVLEKLENDFVWEIQHLYEENIEKEDIDNIFRTQVKEKLKLFKIKTKVKFFDMNSEKNQYIFFYELIRKVLKYCRTEYKSGIGENLDVKFSRTQDKIDNLSGKKILIIPDFNVSGKKLKLVIEEESVDRTDDGGGYDDYVVRGKIYEDENNRDHFTSKLSKNDVKSIRSYELKSGQLFVYRNNKGKILDFSELLKSNKTKE